MVDLQLSSGKESETDWFSYPPQHMEMWRIIWRYKATELGREKTYAQFMKEVFDPYSRASNPEVMWTKNVVDCLWDLLENDPTLVDLWIKDCVASLSISCERRKTIQEEKTNENRQLLSTGFCIQWLHKCFKEQKNQKTELKDGAIDTLLKLSMYADPALRMKIYLQIVPLFMPMYEKELLQYIDHLLLAEKEEDCLDGFYLLIACFDYVKEMELKKEKYKDIFLERGLLSSNYVGRRRALFLMKKMAEEEKNLWETTGWEDFFLLYETLEERTIHIVQPVFEQLFDKVPFWTVIMRRALANANMSIRKMCLQTLFSSSTKGFQEKEFVLTELMLGCDVHCLFANSKPALPTSELGDALCEFYRRILTHEPTKEMYEMYLNTLCTLHTLVAFVHFLHVLDFVPPFPCIENPSFLFSYFTKDNHLYMPAMKAIVSKKLFKVIAYFTNYETCLSPLTFWQTLGRLEPDEKAKKFIREKMETKDVVKDMIKQYLIPPEQSDMSSWELASDAIAVAFDVLNVTKEEMEPVLNKIRKVTENSYYATHDYDAKLLLLYAKVKVEPFPDPSLPLDSFFLKPHTLWSDSFVSLLENTLHPRNLESFYNIACQYLSSRCIDTSIYAMQILSIVLKKKTFAPVGDVLMSVYSNNIKNRNYQQWKEKLQQIRQWECLYYSLFSYVTMSNNVVLFLIERMEMAADESFSFLINALASFSIMMEEEQLIIVYEHAMDRLFHHRLQSKTFYEIVRSTVHFTFQLVGKKNDLVLQFGTRLIELANHRKKIMSWVVDPLVSYLTKNHQEVEKWSSLLLPMLTYGPERLESEKIRDFSAHLCSYPLPIKEQDYYPRVVLLSFFNQLDADAHVDSFCLLLLEKIKEYRSPNAFPNSSIHKNRIRLWIALIVLSPLIKQPQLIMDKTKEEIQHERVASTHALMTVFLVNLYSRFPHLIDIQFLADHSHRPSAVATSITIVYLLLKMDLIPNRDEAMSYFLSWLLSANFTIKASAMYALAFSDFPSLPPHMKYFLSHMPDAQKAYSKVSSLYLLSPTYHPLKNNSLQDIFTLLHHYDVDVSEILSISVFPHSAISNIPWKSNSPQDDGSLASSLAKEEQELENKIPIDPVSTCSGFQKKMMPWESVFEFDFYQTDDDHASGSSQQNPHAMDLVVVASLIDKPTNVGGLARTCEILGASKLIVHSLHILKDPLFQSLAVTADKWIPIEQVSISHLSSYLLLQKENGYRLIGIEQTSHSHSLLHYQFHPHCIFLLGSEKDGIPPDLLALLDDCIEIPQFGKVRSLNVHVSGSLVLWEARKQFLKK